MVSVTPMRFTAIATNPACNRYAGGLIFPGDRPPDYFDFAYFSFVVGMCCQVSDVQITSRRMRRITLSTAFSRLDSTRSFWRC